jgi:uncharacterized protein YgbK (DUF1537 family)
MPTAPKHRVAIVADDLTSAADGAAPFVARGLAALVARGQPSATACDVLAVDCGSRSASRSLAVTRVADVTARLAGRHVLYKTVDSTLRGHVRAELEACFKAAGRKTLVFAPAFPAAGRTTVCGIQLVDGVPVSGSAYGRDPVHPARESALAQLVPAAASNVILLDATTQQELDAAVAALPDPESILWVGSPGMAMALARCLVPAASTVEATPVPEGDVLVVMGSANPCSHRQADRIEPMRGVTLLRAPGEREDDPAAVLERTAAKATQLLLNGPFGTLIATGGDTMEAILDRLGIREFKVLQELEPGFPLGLATLGRNRQLMLAMKAGGFGDDDTLRSAVARLRRATPFSWTST